MPCSPMSICGHVAQRLQLSLRHMVTERRAVRALETELSVKVESVVEVLALGPPQAV
jgi:hypothetical protein